jgi:hypothetical protein
VAPEGVPGPEAKTASTDARREPDEVLDLRDRLRSQDRVDLELRTLDPLELRQDDVERILRVRVVRARRGAVERHDQPVGLGGEESPAGLLRQAAAGGAHGHLDVGRARLANEVGKVRMQERVPPSRELEGPRLREVRPDRGATLVRQELPRRAHELDDEHAPAAAGRAVVPVRELRRLPQAAERAGESAPLAGEPALVAAFGHARRIARAGTVREFAGARGPGRGGKSGRNP